jgi:ABC-type sugar transport system permease subunit
LDSQSFGHQGVKPYRYFMLISGFALVTLAEFHPPYPIRLNLTNSDGTLTRTYFLQMLTNSDFWITVVVSLAFVTTSTLMALTIGLGMTFLLTRQFRRRGSSEVLFLLPLALVPIFVAIRSGPSVFWRDLQSFLHFGASFIGAHEPSVLFNPNRGFSVVGAAAVALPLAVTIASVAVMIRSVGRIGR